MWRNQIWACGIATLISVAAFQVAHADEGVDSEYDVAHCVPQISKLAVIQRSDDIDYNKTIVTKSETTNWLNGVKKTKTSTTTTTVLDVDNDRTTTTTAVVIVDFDDVGHESPGPKQPDTTVTTAASGEIKSPKHLGIASVFQTLANVRFGSSGFATILPQCQAEDEWNFSGGSVPADVTDTGATLSVGYDGVQKKQTINLSGAVGVNYRVSHNWNLNLYARIDDETQHSSYQNPKDTKTSELYEIGSSVRTQMWPFNLNDIIRTGDDNDRTFYFYMIAQPYFVKDELRQSALAGGNIYWVPIYPGLNQYTNAGRCGTKGDFIYSRTSERCVDKSGFHPQSVSPSYNGFYWGTIVDFRLDSGDFTSAGNSLAQPILPPGKSASASHPLYLPNDNFVRVGGRVGAFAQFFPDHWLSSIVGNKPVNAFAYYRDFEGIYGVHHDFSEVVGQVSIPVSPLLSLALTYKNGRNENIAAREESVNVAIKVSGP